MKKEIRGAATSVAVLVVLALLVVSFQPGLPLEALLQSLRFHIAAGLLALAILLVVIGARWRGLLFALLCVASVAEGGTIIWRQQQARAFADAGTTPLLKLISFNTLQDNMRNGGRIADMLIASGADVIYLMEAGPLEPYQDKLKAVYPYVAGCGSDQGCSTVMLSKTPLTDISVRSLSSVWSKRLVIAKTVIGGQTINLVQAHLVKPYFDDFAQGEAWQLHQILGTLPGPLVLAGDFNAAAWSDTIDRLAEGSGLAPPPIYPATWPVRLGPLGVPIDNVWTRAPLVVTKVDAMADAMGSNHRGLVIELGLAKSQ